MSVLVDDLDHVRTLTLHRPERRNAFNHEMYAELATALAAVAADAAVHCVVITGGDGCFSAGQDLKELAELASGGRPAGAPQANGFSLLLDELETFPKPLLAAVDGPAVGIGMTMLLHCDIVLVSDAARMRVPFSELGVPPEAGSSALLADRIGWQAASELLFTSKWIDGPEAVRLGLALRVVPAATLASEAAALAALIASQSPVATSIAKRLMLEARGSRATDARARENAQFVAVFARNAGT
jgi:enoyl-CoA hydratase/carnithine racemase